MGFGGVGVCVLCSVVSARDRFANWINFEKGGGTYAYKCTATTC